jgi:excisionase family DNA binding protein
MDTVITRKWYSVPEVAQMLGYGQSKTKFLVLSGEIRSVKDGRYRRILPESGSMTTFAAWPRNKQHDPQTDAGQLRGLDLRSSWRLARLRVGDRSRWNPAPHVRQGDHLRGLPACLAQAAGQGGPRARRN